MYNNDRIKKSIIDSIILISLMVTYIIYGIEILPLLIFFIPIPFIVVGIRNGINLNIISIFIVSIVISLLLNFATGLSIIMLVAPLSISINHCIKKRKNTMETIIISTASLFVSLLLMFIIEKNFLNINIAKEMEEMFMLSLSLQIEYLNGLGATGSQLLQAKYYYESFYKTIIILIPSLMVVFSLVVSYVNLVLSTLVLRKMGYGIYRKHRFSKFKLPNSIIPGIGVVFVIAFILIKANIEYSYAFLNNLTFLTGFIFILQGLAILDFLLLKTKIKTFFRILILGLVFVPMSSVFFIIGLLDQVFDLRKMRKQKS